MKKKLLISAGLLAVGAVALLMVPRHVRGGITGSAHDFSGESWTTNSEICVACHTPHNANLTGLSTEAPLWNHGVTTQNFTTYGGVDINGTIGQPGTISRLCLSCHDGTIALDAFGGTTGTAANVISGSPMLGTTLADDHPVGLTWPTTDPEIYASTAATTAGLPLFGTSNDTLECATCHDVHNTATGTNPYLLRLSNTGSNLCLTCHNK